MDKTLLKHVASLHPEEIRYPFGDLLHTVGFDAVYEFIERLEGFSIYVPTMRKVFAGCLEQEVRNEFNGANFFDLATKYGYTERHIRRMVE